MTVIGHNQLRTTTILLFFACSSFGLNRLQLSILSLCFTIYGIQLLKMLPAFLNVFFDLLEVDIGEFCFVVNLRNDRVFIEISKFTFEDLDPIALILGEKFFMVEKDLTEADPNPALADAVIVKRGYCSFTRSYHILYHLKAFPGHSDRHVFKFVFFRSRLNFLRSVVYDDVFWINFQAFLTISIGDGNSVNIQILPSLFEIFVLLLPSVLHIWALVA